MGAVREVGGVCLRGEAGGPAPDGGDLFEDHLAAVGADLGVLLERRRGGYRRSFSGR